MLTLKSKGLLFFSIFFVLFLFVGNARASAAWLSGWNYRKQITITGQSGAGTNFQVKLKIGESSGSSGADFNLGGVSTSTFPSGKNAGGDLRFTSSDGQTLLNFWVESIASSTPNRTATLWVKVSADLGSDQNIYVYYGNGSAANGSSGDNTFILFDDFEGSSLDSTKWAEQAATNSSVSVSGSQITFSSGALSGGKNYVWIDSKNTYTYPVWTETKVDSFDASGATYRMGATTGVTPRADNGNLYNEFSADALNTSGYRIVSDSSGGGYMNAQTGHSISDTNGIWSFAWISTNSQKFYLNYASNLSSAGGNGISIGNYYMYLGNASNVVGSSVVDWARIRKYAATEPSFNTAAAQENYVDHFTIASVSSPQAASSTFAITIIAKDSGNSTTTNYVGTVDLTTNTGSISPSVSGSFVSGVLTQSVTLTGAGTNRSITVTDHGGVATGTSNTFTLCDASGGTITQSGNYCIHSFTSSTSTGAFVAPSKGLFGDVLAVGGGGGGGANVGGGGGAGGYRYLRNFSISGGTTTVTVGAGGAGGIWNGAIAQNGSSSVFSTITAAGGGGGADDSTPSTHPASSGGSGGGGAYSVGVQSGGSGNTPSTIPSQGNNGGNGYTGGGYYNSAGGGGSGSVGSDADTSDHNGSNGGIGTANSITGSSVYYAGGGGAGADNYRGGSGGTGGLGGGGNGGTTTSGSNGTANTGGGGGGGTNSPSRAAGGSGGSGIVIVRYLINQTPLNSIGSITGTAQVGSVLSSGAVTDVNNNTVATSSLTYQWSESATSNGTYSDISGATSSVYSLVSGDLNMYLKVTATGTGSYTGFVVSSATGQIANTSPSAQANSISFSSVASSSISISWSNGNGSNRVVFVKQTNSGTTSPTNSTTYIANTIFGSGTQIGSSGWYCVYNGSSNTVNITGLSANTAYIAQVFEYNGSAGSEVYNTGTGSNNPLPQTTKYSLVYISGANGSVSGTSTQYILAGASGASVTALPNTGYHFTSWSDSSSNNPRTDLNVAGNISVTAGFAINTYTLSYSAGAHGTISGSISQTVNYNASGSAVTAVADSGYHFTGWDDGGLVATRTDVNVVANHTYTANFAVTDVDAPVITVTDIFSSATGAIVEWSTDENSSSLINYGLTASTTLATAESNTSPRVLGHSVRVSGLISCARYYYKIQSTDAYSNTGYSGIGTFKTSGCTGDATITDTGQGSATITSGGSLSEGNISVVAPANFTNATSSLIIQANKLDSGSFAAVAGTPSGRARAGSDVYTLKAFMDATTNVSNFDSALTVKMNYSAADVANIFESSLWIYRYDGSTWYPLDNCSVDSSLKVVTCQTNHFSDFAIFGQSSGTSSGSGGGGGGGSITIANPSHNGFGTSTSSNLGVPSSDLKINNILIYSTSTAPIIKASIKKFERNLKFGSTGEDVKNLQKFLNLSGFGLAKTGDGSPGKETYYFGELTRLSLIKFQESHSLEILKPLGESRGTGNFMKLSREVANKIIAGSR